MRYFRYTDKGPRIGYVYGQIIATGDSGLGIPLPEDYRWEEVIVTPKPEPKTSVCPTCKQPVQHSIVQWTKKVALYAYNGDMDKLYAAWEGHWAFNKWKPVTEFVEVTFTFIPPVDMAFIAVTMGLFSSKTQARKNGWLGIPKPLYQSPME
jgi:hypothetical protein